MSSISGDCFFVSVPNSKEIIIGRNSLKDNSEVKEICFELASAEKNLKKCDGGAEFTEPSPLSVIIERPKSIWGSECGANEKNVHINVTWAFGEPENSESSLKSTDIVRLALESSNNANEAIYKIGNLIESYGSETSKFNFLVADPENIWILSCANKLWVCENLTECGFKRIPINGLTVGTKIDKSIENLNDKLKDSGIWDGSDDLNFGKLFSAEPIEELWPRENKPTEDGSFNLRNMLEVLRSTDSNSSSAVSTLNSSGISCHWFTATPKTVESVYKPFVFAPNPKISPLTKLKDNDLETLLHKLHTQRNWESIGDLLKSLESNCIDEVEQFLNSNPEPNEELDELMKDCVEAEVKFYR